VLEHILEAHGNVPFAVVSGSERKSVIASLTTLGILDRFDTLVCAGDYVNAKPAPDPFLLAAERLGIAPSDCLVFEDTEMGIASATAAGMASVRILQPHERGDGYENRLAMVTAE
jgi:HAD superfamily hydrolase (TIGR01509 family)